ncbi:hypothetical protein ACHAWF_009277, partial [Thalassiosira exigua]
MMTTQQPTAAAAETAPDIDSFLQGRCRSNGKSGEGMGEGAGPPMTLERREPSVAESFVAGLRSHVAFQVGTCLDNLAWVEAASLLEVATRDFPFLAEMDWDKERKVRAARFPRVAEAKSVAPMALRATMRKCDTAGNTASSKTDGKEPRSQRKKRKRAREAEKETSQEANASVGQRAKLSEKTAPAPSAPFQLTKSRQRRANGGYLCMFVGCDKKSQNNTGIDGTFNDQLCQAHHTKWKKSVAVEAAEVPAQTSKRGRLVASDSEDSYQSSDDSGQDDDARGKISVPPSKEKLREYHRRSHTTFEERLEQCRTFKMERGNLDVPPDNGCHSTRLGAWIEKMREDYRKLLDGRLDELGEGKRNNVQRMKGKIADRLEVLEELGFAFEPYGGTSSKGSSSTPVWDWRRDQCRRFKAENGHLNIVKDKDLVMGPWAERMRGLYKRRAEGGVGRLTSVENEKLRTLEALGFAFDGTFDVKFHMLAEYMREEGHCRVPTKTVEHRSLANWVERLRREYAQMNAGEGSTYLTQDRLRKLYNIGFVFKTRKGRQVPWEIKFQRLKAYREEHGKDPLTSHAELGDWVVKQRLYYNKKKDGVKNHRMPDDREEKLESIGF